jgi:ParB family transcriptional regulator, chromosome partitioning protein
LPADADLSEISLAENVQREDMDPLDECMAFQRLVHGGKSIPDIAARFGYSENLIERRLALACLNPFVLDQYRAGKATLELLQAFTLTNDHAAQEHVWNQLPDWNRQAQSVRRLLSHRDIPASDAQVRYVTLSAYEAAGGATKRDLFADEEGNGVYVTDAELLTTLVTEKLQQAAARIEKDGWGWVDIRLETDYSTLGRYRHIQGEALPLTRKEQARRGALAKEHDALADQLDGNEEETEECQALYDRIESLEEEIRAIDSNTKYAYPDHVKQNAGVIVTLAEDGQPRYHYGLVRKEDEATLAKSSNDTHEPPPCDEEEGKKGSAYSAALVEALTAHKTAAIATELSRQPHTTLAATVYTLLLREFSVELDICSTQSALQISEQHTNLREAEDSAAGKALSERRQELLSILPRGSKLWPWCLEQTVETLLECLAGFSCCYQPECRTNEGRLLFRFAFGARECNRLRAAYGHNALVCAQYGEFLHAHIQNPYRRRAGGGR